MAKGKGRRRGAAKGRKMRPSRKTTNVPDRGSLSETIDYGALNVGTPYSFNDVQLAQFTRATNAARAYQFYRIKSVLFKVQPLLDTFASTGNSQVPYLYWMINRTGNAFPALSKAWFIANGAKGIRFDEKDVNIRYTPSIIVDATEAANPGIGNQANLPKRAPWLTTNRDAFGAVWNPSQVSHCGHFMNVYSEGSAVAMQYRVTLTVEWEFKKPLAPPPTLDDPKATLVVPASTMLV